MFISAKCSRLYDHPHLEGYHSVEPDCILIYLEIKESQGRLLVVIILSLGMVDKLILSSLTFTLRLYVESISSNTCVTDISMALTSKLKHKTLDYCDRQTPTISNITSVHSLIALI